MSCENICGGSHRHHEWSKEEINSHLVEPCLDCWCGVPFKMKGDVEYKYYSCTQPIGEFCKKHQLNHRPCSNPARIERADKKGGEE